jgi:hypothetical protein
MRSPHHLLLAATLAVAAALPAGATSSASSAASESVGLSSNGVSASLRTSSNSSTKTNVAQGEYRVVEVAAADVPGTVALKLQLATASGPATDDNAFLLLLPQATFERSGVATGTRVQATQRNWGLEFARADTRQAFFLVLQDRAMQELQTVPVTM